MPTFFIYRHSLSINQNNQNHESESGVNSLAIFKKHPTQCVILIILLIYFLISIYTIYSELAQLAEHLTVNQVVAGSSPAGGAKNHITLYAPLAQLVEQLTLNQWVQGSSPWRCTSWCFHRTGSTCTHSEHRS